MHFAFWASEMLEWKTCSHLQSAFEQRIMWNLTSYFSILSYTWHFIYSLSPASNWPVQYYLELRWLGIKVNSFVLRSQVQSPIQLRCSQQGKASNENFQLPQLRDSHWVKHLPPHTYTCECTKPKISLKAARSWESITLEANRYIDPLASWPFLLSGSASACSSIAACTEQARLQLKSVCPLGCCHKAPTRTGGVEHRQLFQEKLPCEHLTMILLPLLCGCFSRVHSQALICSPRPSLPVSV